MGIASSLLVMMLAAGAPSGLDYSSRGAARVAPRAQLAEHVKLYKTICLKRFPQDESVESEMKRRGARPMSPDEVRVFLHDDPGVGWVLAGRTSRFNVTIEGPPYHACTVRAMTPAGYGDMGAYRRLRDRFERGGGYSPIKPMDGVQDGLQLHAEAETRLLGGGVEELLILAVAQVSDPVLRAKGDTAVEIRFVHQIVSPPDAPTS